MPSISECLARRAGEVAATAWRILPGTRSDDPLAARIALWITLATFATIVLLTLSILVLHRRNVLREQRDKRWRDRWLVQLLDPEGSGGIASLRPRQLPLFQSLWNHVHASMRGDIRRSIVAASRNAGTIPLSLARLRHGSLGERILSATFLGNHQETAAIEPLAAMAESPDSFLSLACTQALLRIDPPHQLPRLLGTLLRREDWPLPQVHDILSEVDAELLSAHLPGAFLRWYPEPSPRSLRLLSLVHEDVRVAIVDILSGRRQPPTPEAQAAMLREIRSPTQLHLVRRGLDSTHWPVVVAALNTLAQLGSREDLPRLSELLGHKEWWVRYRAARAIVLLPDVKAIEAELMATRHPDRFGREMLRYALAERNMR